MMACVDDATAGCTYDQQQEWIKIVNDFNLTLQSDFCYMPCTNQSTKADLMFKCFTDANFESLISDIQTSSSAGPADPKCLLLKDMNNCLTGVTANCPALTDVSHDRISSVDPSGAAYSKCGVPTFSAATTNAPVGLMDTNSMTPNAVYATTTKVKTDVGQLILIILGAIVITATIIVVLIVIILTVRRRRAAHRRSIFKDWRPNGQKVYRDEPQYVTTAAAEQEGFRPLRYTNRSGFLNEAVVVD
jgi:hypothetical protein